MTHPSTSLVDILQPPRNNWLRQLSRRKASLPEGVRVVRFGNPDEEEIEGVESPRQSALPTKSSATASARRMPSTAAESIPPA